MSLLAAAIGTILGSIYFILGDYRVLIAGIVCLFISTMAFTSLVHRRKEILSCFIAFLIVFFNYNLRSEHLEYVQMENIINAQVTSRDYYCQIISNPRDKFFKSQFIIELKAKHPNLKERFREIFLPYRIIAKADSSHGLSINDVVGLSNPEEQFKLEKLKGNQAKVYKKDKVFYQATNKDIVYVSHKDSWIHALQGYIHRYFSRYLSPENAQITTSLVLGSQVVEIPQRINPYIFNLGLGHLFAASGFNLMLLSLMLTWIANLFRLKAKIYAPIIILASFIYTGLAGFSPSIVRADILITAFLILGLMKRKPRSMHFLCYLAAILLLIDPYTIFDIGFQLSYLATLAILIWTPRINNKLQDISYIPSYFKEVISVTIAVQILLLPLIMYYFDTLQVWSILANLVVAPIFSVLTVSSFLGLCFIIEPLLNLFKYFLELSSHLPYIDSHVNINLETFIFLVFAFNLSAYSIFNNREYTKPEDKQNDKLDDFFIRLFLKGLNDKYLRASVIIVSISMIIAINLVPPNIVKLKIKDGIIEGNKELVQIIQDKNINYKYFKINKLDTLIIKKRSSLKDLNGLVNNIREVNLLILPRLKETDIYFDTLVELVKPQFIICSATKETPKVMQNLEILGKHANTIVNSGILYIGDEKFWSIAEI
jgi:ComEC/Rec2-related protein